MKSEKTKTKHLVVENLSKIMKDKDIKQETIAEYADVAPSQMSRILSGNVQLSLWQLSNIATRLKINVIDVFTYPDIYEKMEKGKKMNRIMIEFELTDEEFYDFGLIKKIKNKYNL